MHMLVSYELKKKKKEGRKRKTIKENSTYHA